MSALTTEGLPEDSIEAKRASAIRDNRCFAKTTLRNVYRMKPKPGVEPVKYYQNNYGQQFGVFQIQDCVPLRARSCKPPSCAQQRASKLLGLKAKLNSKYARASQLAKSWIDEDVLVGDTESTGKEGNDQVIETA